MTVDTFVNSEGKIYLNIIDLIRLVKDTIEQAKQKQIDTYLTEEIFLWLSQQHTAAEQQLNVAKQQGEINRLKELQVFWEKYGSVSNVSNHTSKKNSD